MRFFVTFLCGVLLMASVARGKGETIETAILQFEAGSYSTATATLRVVLAREPQNAYAYHWLGRCYYELKNFDDAITQAERAVSLEPRKSEYRLWLARAFGEKADRDSSPSAARKVGRELQEAVRLDPLNLAARRDLVEFYADAPWILGGSDDKARQEAQAIAAVDAVEGHLAWAEYWRSKKDIVRVDAAYRKVLELRPSRIDPYMEIADYYQERKDVTGLDAAVKAASRASAADPRLAYFRGALQVLTGTMPAEAERLLNQYLASVPPRSEFPSQASAREWLARLYEQQGNRVKAAEQYRAILRLDPHRKGAREALRRLESQS